MIIYLQHRNREKKKRRVFYTQEAEHEAELQTEMVNQFRMTCWPPAVSRPKRPWSHLRWRPGPRPDRAGSS